MKRDVYIRADGNEQIGLGHLVRCSALAYMLKDDFDITFYCRLIPEKLETEFRGNNLRIEHIDGEKDFISIVSPDKIVVLDGYDFNTDYQKAIKEKGAKLVCIDDLHEKEYVADLIINHTPGITPQHYRARPYTLFALGLEYALLRPAFLEQARRIRKRKKTETLMIACGGADPKRITEEALKAGLEFNLFKKIIVVTGAAHKIDDSLLQLLEADKRIEHRQALTEKQMMQTMLESDIAVLPASGILFEALATGCTIVVGRYAENQKLVYKNFKNAGFFLDAGNFGPEEIRQALNNALTQPKYEKAVFDGNSKGRIVKIFEKIQREGSISLRTAQKEDLELTYAWAISQEVRRYSFQQHKITLLEHTSWFLKKINHSSCVYLIGETGGISFGSIRFDIKDNNATISYLVDPEFHGQGLGLILLKKGIEELMIVMDQQDKTINTIFGLVMKPNIPSIKSFERLGFAKVEFTDKYKFFKQI